MEPLIDNVAVYPGTFDPLTLGHLDLICRSARIFGKLQVAVAAVTNKSTAMFSLEERLAMVHEAVSEMPNVTVAPLNGLLVDFCQKRGINVIVRGLRAYSDFEYEFQMALTNRKLNPGIETLFMMPQEEHSYVTASTVREVARYGGDTSRFLPPAAQRQVVEYMRHHTAADDKRAGGRSGGSGAFDC